MKKFLFLIIYFASTFLSYSNNLNLINKVEQYFNNIETLSAEFTQYSLSRDQKSSTGKLYISKPGMLKFDYLAPKRLTIILREGNIMYHNHELDEISYIKQDNYFFKILSEKNLQLSDKVNTISLNNNNIHMYIEKKLDDKITKINMIFLHNPLQLKEVHIKNNDMEDYTLQFKNITYNQKFDSRFFSFQHPKFYSAPYTHEHKN